MPSWPLDLKGLVEALFIAIDNRRAVGRGFVGFILGRSLFVLRLMKPIALWRI